jgi:hypothetical protein
MDMWILIPTMVVTFFKLALTNGTSVVIVLIWGMNNITTPTIDSKRIAVIRFKFFVIEVRIGLQMFVTAHTDIICAASTPIFVIRTFAPFMDI